MARTAGARNHDFEVRRLTLAAALRTRLVERTGKRPSYAELAEAAGVSLATLRHYFGTRDQAVAAVLQMHAALGEPHLARLRLPNPDFSVSVREAADHIAEGLDQPLVAELHAIGMAEGVAHPATGPAYLTTLLEPMIQALEERLSRHVAAGQMRAVDLRVAAISLLAPLVLAHLHQDWLGGDRTRYLDKNVHRACQVDAFLRAFAPQPAGGARPSG
jgi:AcrR family transcriptional regulator